MASFDKRNQELSAREREVLYAVLTEFIQTGEPVGSRTLSKLPGMELSAASIRNVLKDLEDAGYLHKPHTSAGRVPTRQAFQVFIDALMEVRRLPEQHAARIRTLFSSRLAAGDLLRESGRLLSDLSGLPAVVLRSPSEVRRVTKIRFIAHRPRELLSVVILDDGTVENRFIALERSLDASTLERVHNLLDDVTADRTLVEVRAHLEKLVRKQKDELGELGSWGNQLLGSALEGAVARPDVIVEGRSTLFAGESDPSRVRALMIALEDRERLVELLDRTVRSTRVQVFLGEDSPGAQPEPSPLSIVAAPYLGTGSQPIGVVGTVGPTRMDYPGLIPLVETMALALSRSLQNPQGHENSDEPPEARDTQLVAAALSRSSIDRDPGGG
jgi:heat-inducible transcriptional repressor